MRNLPFAVSDQPGVASSIFLSLARAGLNVDVIVQNTSREGTTDVSFTVAQTDALEAENLMKEISLDIGAESIEVDSNIMKGLDCWRRDESTRWCCCGNVRCVEGWRDQYSDDHDKRDKVTVVIERKTALPLSNAFTRRFSWPVSNPRNLRIVSRQAST